MKLILLFLLFISCNSKVYQYHSGKTHIESSEPITTSAVLQMEQRLQMDDYPRDTIFLCSDFDQPIIECADSIQFIGLNGVKLGRIENTLIVKRPCDHFFIKQSITIEDTTLHDQDWEWMPCICLHCKEITICK